MKSKLKFVLQGGAVRRYHTMRTLHAQNVAEHSFGVAWLVYLLTDGKPSVNLLMAALGHDIAEHVTGDLPAPAKRAMELGARFAAAEDVATVAAGLDIPELTEEESKILKLADTAELVLYCMQEVSMGNLRMHDVMARGLSYIEELGPFSTQAEQLLEAVGGLYDDECQ